MLIFVPVWRSRPSGFCGIKVAKLHLAHTMDPASIDLFNLKERVMSAPARQTRTVDLMRDDPERLLDVSEAAVLLHVKTKTLYAWVSRNKIPYRKINSLVRFHRGELIEWAKGQQQNASKATPNSLSVVK